MPIHTDDEITVFILNVGQADASIIVTPAGKVAVIDAVAPAKMVSLLKDLGLGHGEKIEELILTHPHHDHYSGAARLLTEYDVRHVVLSSFKLYQGTLGYHSIIKQIERKNIPSLFAPAHNTLYLDGAMISEEKRVVLDLIGPSQGILNELKEVGIFDPNHLSIITRVMFGKFSMVLAADAQMENWQHFDMEGMMRQSCSVVKAAHHGSRHGTQAERLERLKARYVIVSSDPDSGHNLPDLVGAATLCELSRKGLSVALTRDTGTVRVSAKRNGEYHVYCYGEGPRDNVSLAAAQPYDPTRNSTDWPRLIRQRLG